MASDEPSSYLLPLAEDLGLIEYTIGAANDALRGPHGIARRNRAEGALDFFLDLFDPSVDAERQQLETFRAYRAALDGRSHPCPILTLSNIIYRQTLN